MTQITTSKEQLYPGTYAYQNIGGEELWKTATHEELAELLASRPPMFRTILAQSGTEDEPPLFGPFYADFDDDLEEVIPAFRRFTDKLIGLGLDLSQTRISLSGGRGLHLEVPPECFMTKPEPVQGLHLTFREMAMELYVEGLDHRVYSKRRMWRVHNVKRPNGLHKVQITVEELAGLTPETYRELASTPRPLFDPEPPTFCKDLGYLFVKHRDRERIKAKKRGASTRTNTQFAKSVGETLPETLENLLAGEIPSIAGWNQVALQVAAAALALGWSEDELVERSKGLIESHESDGRYFNQSKREKELRNQHRYQNGNPDYTASIGGLISILPEGTRADDLRDLEQDESPVGKAVGQANERHAVIFAGGTACILREGPSEFGGQKIEFINKSSLQMYWQNRTVDVPSVDPRGEPTVKSLPLSKVWLEHRNRRTYEGVTFAPCTTPPEGFMNLWRGFNVEPSQADSDQLAQDCGLLLEHMRDNICNGDAEHFSYLMAWLADLVQRPTKKPGVALVMRGTNGVGKSKLADVLRHILGGHAFKASKSEHIVGKFNAHLVDKLLIVAEESFFAGAKADIGTLKDLITSDSITIEPKHVSAIEVRSCHRVLMATNSQWAVPASEDERRYFVLDVGAKRMQDYDYFAAIDDQIYRQGGAEAFLGLLLRFDLSEVNLRKVPQTSGLKAQKVLSLSPTDSFILDALLEGVIVGRDWLHGEEPARERIYEAYVQHCRNMHERAWARNRFFPRFELVTGSKAFQGTTRADRSRRCMLLDRDEALSTFAAHLKVSVEDLI